MTAIWLRSRAELRASAALIVIVALAGGSVLAGFLAARRTDRAFPNFLAYNHPPDAAVSGVDLKAVERIPQVFAADQESYVPLVAEGSDGRPDLATAASLFPMASVGGKKFRVFARPIMVAGKQTDPEDPYEVSIGESLAGRLNLKPEGSLRLRAYLPERYSEVVSALQAGGTFPSPNGPVFNFKVTGIERQPQDIRPPQLRSPAPRFVSDNIYLTPAFFARFGSSVARSKITNVSVALKRGPADLNDFKAAVLKLPGARPEAISSASEAYAAVKSARQSAEARAQAFRLLAIVIALASFLLFGQAVAREVQLHSPERATLRALGMSFPQMLAVQLLRGMGAGVIGGAAAIGLAVLISPHIPIGLAKMAEPPGSQKVTSATLLLGAGVIVGVVVVQCVLAELLERRRLERDKISDSEPTRSSWLRWLSSAPISPSMVVGLCRALQPGLGPAAPMRAALLTAIVGLASVVASLTFGASLNRLVDSRDLQGRDYDAVVGYEPDPGQIEIAIQRLRNNREVAGFSSLADVPGSVLVKGHNQQPRHEQVTTFEGSVVPRWVKNGHEPRTADEVVLGNATARRLERQVGDRVVVVAGNRSRELTVVGVAVFGPGFHRGGMGDGLLVSPAVAQSLGLQPSSPHLVVQFVKGVNDAAATQSLQREIRKTVEPSTPSQAIANLDESRGLPFLLAAVLGGLGAATVGHALISSIHHRRRELVILKALGFVRHQVVAVVVWEAIAFSVVAVLVGIPLGLLVGRWAWLAVDSNLQSVSQPVTPVFSVILAIPAALVVTNLVASTAGLIAARMPAAPALHSE